MVTYPFCFLGLLVATQFCTSLLVTRLVLYSGRRTPPLVYQEYSRAGEGRGEQVREKHMKNSHRQQVSMHRAVERIAAIPPLKRINMSRY